MTARSSVLASLQLLKSWSSRLLVLGAPHAVMLVSCLTTCGAGLQDAARDVGMVKMDRHFTLQQDRSRLHLSEVVDRDWWVTPVAR